MYKIRLGSGLNQQTQDDRILTDELTSCRTAADSSEHIFLHSGRNAIAETWLNRTVPFIAKFPNPTRTYHQRGWPARTTLDATSTNVFLPAE
jgi:hypothetical protein